MNCVNVAMAVYNPRPDWLRLQLESVDAQEYPDIEVIAVDDASDRIPHGQIAEIFAASLRRVPYRLHRNPANTGSDAVFELLTGMAEGEYISYCDQDDIWEPQKTGELVAALRRFDAALAYSDMSVMDADGAYTAGSLQNVRRRLKYFEGGGLAEKLLFRNFISGTSMLTHTETARKAMPFVTDMPADHWLALWCSAGGRIAFVPTPLVRYRIHGGNQSAILAGVNGKADYLGRRILPGISRFRQFEKRFEHAPELAGLIRDGQRWLEARRGWFAEAGDVRRLWKLRRLGIQTSMFELLTARMPEPLFMSAVRLIKRGLL